MLEWVKHIPDAVKILGSLLTFIQLLVRTAETPGHGPEKQAAVLKGVEDTLDEHNVDKPLQNVVLRLAKGVISVYVCVQNFMGFFSHKKE